PGAVVSRFGSSETGSVGRTIVSVPPRFCASADATSAGMRASANSPISGRRMDGLLYMSRRGGCAGLRRPTVGQLVVSGLAGLRRPTVGQLVVSGLAGLRRPTVGQLVVSGCAGLRRPTVGQGTVSGCAGLRRPTVGQIVVGGLTVGR